LRKILNVLNIKVQLISPFVNQILSDEIR